MKINVKFIFKVFKKKNNKTWIIMRKFVTHFWGEYKHEFGRNKSNIIGLDFIHSNH